MGSVLPEAMTKYAQPLGRADLESGEVTISKDWYLLLLHFWTDTLATGINPADSLFLGDIEQVALPPYLPTSTGTANAKVIRNVPQIGNGFIQWFIPNSANTGATTIVVDGIGAKSILYLSQALTGGELQTGVPALIIWDGTNWNLMYSAKGPATDTYTDTGSVNALAVTANGAQGLVNGLRIKVLHNNTTTNASPTLNYNGGGALNILNKEAIGTPAGSIIINQIGDYIYEATANSWIIQNPSAVTGSFTGTLTGVGSGSGTITYIVSSDCSFCSMGVAAAITGTSNSTALTVTGLPAIVQAATAYRGMAMLEDAGSPFQGTFRSPTSGTLTLEKAFSTTGFTNTATLKGLAITTMIYPLRN